MRTIIGLDLGKFNSAACAFLTGDGAVRLVSHDVRAQRKSSPARRQANS